MKRLVYLMCFLMLIVCGCKNKATVRNDAVISFIETEYDFGTIEHKKPVSHRFEFSNAGKTPLIINDVMTSCGCTAAEWTKTVIKPGEKGFISVEFDAELLGPFNKMITVSYNGATSPAYLFFRVEVIKGSTEEIENE